MKILFDCTFLRNQHTGVDIIFIGLLNALLKIDTSNSYLLITDHRYNISQLKEELKDHKNIEVKSIWCYYPLHILISAFAMPFYIWYKKIDVYHNPYFFGPFFKIVKSKNIITVPDLYHKTIPDKMDALHKRLLNFFSVIAVKKADKIIVISGQTKNDVFKYYKFKASKVVLVLEAIDIEFDEPFIEGFSSKVQQAGIEKNKYILNVGSILANKGVDDLVRAYHNLLQENKTFEFKIVFAGNNNTPYYEKVKNLIQSLDLPDEKVIFLGYTSENDLHNLYKYAKMYVAPSYFEGFGLTVLEAMKFDCPVIARNASSFPEVVEDAGLLFNNVDELSAQIKTLLYDKDLCMQLVEKGKKQINKFSNENKAIQTLSTYTN
jgi:glycosyltransferase involved in cell wall biosynthesis